MNKEVDLDELYNKKSDHQLSILRNAVEKDIEKIKEQTCFSFYPAAGEILYAFSYGLRFRKETDSVEEVTETARNTIDNLESMLESSIASYPGKKKFKEIRKAIKEIAFQNIFFSYVPENLIRMTVFKIEDYARSLQIINDEIYDSTMSIESSSFLRSKLYKTE